MAIPMQDNSKLLELLVGGLTGSKGSSSGSSSSTTKTDISTEGIMRIVDTFLQSNNYAGIGAAESQAGVRNSSSGGMMRNDLLARAAGEAARLSAPTTTNKSESGSTSKEAPSQNIDWGTLLGLGGLSVAGQILGPTVSGAIDKLPGSNGAGLGGIGKSLADLILGGGSASNGNNFADFFPQNSGVETSPITSGSMPEGEELPAFSDEDYIDLSNWWDNFMNESFDMSD